MTSERARGWRRIAAAAWRDPWDPQIYGDLEIDATNLLQLVAAGRAAGVHVTPTHVVGRALGHAFAVVPELNVRLQRGRFVKRESVSVFFIAAVDAGRELTGVRIDDIDRRSLREVAVELGGRMHQVREHHTGDVLERTKRLVNASPWPLLRGSIRISQWMANDLGLDLPRLGLPARPFGSAMITSVGMLGLQHGFAPLAPYYRVPVLLTVGRIQDQPIVVDGHVEVRPVLRVGATIDHRYADGHLIARAAHALGEYLEDPARFEPS